MAKPKTLTKRLNDMDGETIAKNFLLEEADCLPSEEQVVIAKEIPKYEKVVFINNRDAGSVLYFHYESGTHPRKHYTLVHGQEYNLPVEIIRHLEGQNPSDPYACHKRIYGAGMNPEGNYAPAVTGYQSYFQCRTVRA